MKIIIYGSEYGTTESYAKKLSELTGIKAVSYKVVKDARLIVVTVGLADVKDERNTSHIRESIKQQLPKEHYNESNIYHLRGGIDYSKLKFLHRNMMKMVYKKATSLPQDQQISETESMIETYGKSIYFIDFEALNPIITAIKK